MCIRDSYTLNLLKKKDEQCMAKDARIEALMDRLMDKCPNCELAKAANMKKIKFLHCFVV